MSGAILAVKTSTPAGELITQHMLIQFRLT